MHSIGPNDIESIEKKTLTFHAGYSCLAAWLMPMSTGQHILVWSRFIAQCVYATSNDIYTTEGNTYQRIKIVLLCFVGISSWRENIIYLYLALIETNDSILKHWIISLSTRVMPIWGGHEWGSAGDKRNCCCNLFPNHKVFLGMGEDNILVIRWCLDSFEGVNSCCNTCIFKILTSFPSPVLFNYIVYLGWDQSVDVPEKI